MKFFIIFVSLFLSAAACADEVTDYSKETLTGNWNGERDKLKADGVDLQATNYFDFFNRVGGGTAILNNLNFNAILDGDKLVGLEGSTALVSLLQTNGSKPNRTLTGAVERIDDMETYGNGPEVYQVWVQQNFLGGGISILGGIYDASNEFYSTDASDILMNNAYGFGTELAATGKKGEAIFPTSSPALRLRLAPSENFYGQVSLMDGINGAPESREHLHLTTKSNALMIAETGYINEHNKIEEMKIAVGTWRYTDDIGSLIRKEKDLGGNYLSSGSYALAEGYIFHPLKTSDRGLMAFARFGGAAEDADRFDYSFSAGLDYKGLLRYRPKSELTFGIAEAHLSPVYRRSLNEEGIANNGEEYALELTYRDYYKPWMTLQPDYQYIINPDGIKSLPNASVFGLRSEINF